MTRTHFPLTALAATIMLATAGTGYWYTARDGATSVHAVCLPEDNADRNKVGNGGTAAIVIVEWPVEYREEEPDLESGVLMSAVTVTEPLKEAPPTSMVIGQSVVLDGKKRAPATGEPDYALHHPAAAIRHRPDGHA
ncbi:hypothetical protein ACFXPV_35800 [Streptomyces sp. NPDC059118]|uniref:hypothetical protein n=1 Tax=unclassified Streptomyces TaxID=2593676 RepID=UPI00368999D8